MRPKDKGGRKTLKESCDRPRHACTCACACACVHCKKRTMSRSCWCSSVGLKGSNLPAECAPVPAATASEDRARQLSVAAAGRDRRCACACAWGVGVVGVMVLAWLARPPRHVTGRFACSPAPAAVTMMMAAAGGGPGAAGVSGGGASWRRSQGCRVALALLRRCDAMRCGVFVLVEVWPTAGGRMPVSDSR